MPSVSNLINKTHCNTRISEMENKVTTDPVHDKYITTQEFNKLTSEKIYSKTKTSKFSKQKGYC